MSELGRRIATAVVLLPAVVAGVLYLPSGAFSTLMAVFVVVGAWEWSALVGRSGTVSRGAYAVVTGLVLLALDRLGGVGTTALVVAGLVWWGVALVWVVRYQSGVDPSALNVSVVGLGCGWLVLVPCWVAVVTLHGVGEHGPGLVLAVLGLVWAADIGAYFAGRRFGRRRLASRVSPGKSWEGVAGGVAAAAALGVAIAVAAGMVYPASLGFVALAVLTAAVSVLGDLAESMFKRRVGAKDSGTLIPGHGGVLDRIDSITAAAPVFAAGLSLYGGIH